MGVTVVTGPGYEDTIIHYYKYSGKLRFGFRNEPEGYLFVH